MSENSDDGWFDIETTPVPNNVFDLLVRRWDAALDAFTYHRFSDCVQVDGDILTPFVTEDGQVLKACLLSRWNVRPTHWRHIPELPSGVPSLMAIKSEILPQNQ